MIGKVSSDYVRYNFNKAKTSIGNKYAEGKRLLHNVDHGVRLTKKVYSAVAPVINSLAGNENFSKINKHVIKAISGYDNIRQSVMKNHEQAEGHINQTVSNLKKAGISIGL